MAVSTGAALATVAGCHTQRRARHTSLSQRQPRPSTSPPDAQTSRAEARLAELEPYPADAPGCYGKRHDDGYYGQCCVDVICYTPRGDDPCVGPGGVRSVLGDLLPTESGTCSCGVASGDSSVEGPYAPGAEDEDQCCYLSGSIGCDGRAFLMYGQPRVAPVVERQDWLS